MSKQRVLNFSGMTYAMSLNEINSMTRKEKLDSLQALTNSFIACPRNQEHVDDLKKQLELARGDAQTFRIILAQLEIWDMYGMILSSLM